VCGEKPGGLIVDLIGLADPLADALATYANATGTRDKLTSTSPMRKRVRALIDVLACASGLYQQKSLVLETLRKLLTDQTKIVKRHRGIYL
jgi:type I site-specific restriction-modification system R (restriction) subunit